MQFFAVKLTRYLALLMVIFGVNVAFGQHAEVVKFDRLQSVLNAKTPNIQIINFWATWCGPCVQELPFFQSIENRNDPSLKVTLVSLDFADKVDNVDSFIAKKKLVSTVLLLDEPDYNSWIDRVDPRWSGAIPATLIVNTQTGERKFVERALKDGELEKYILELKSSSK